MSSPWRVSIKNSAKQDLKKILRSNLREQFEAVVRQLEQNPYAPTQSFEKLQPPVDRLYSRRINIQHRVVYTVDEQTRTVSIYSAWSHYE